MITTHVSQDDHDLILALRYASPYSSIYKIAKVVGIDWKIVSQVIDSVAAEVAAGTMSLEGLKADGLKVLQAHGFLDAKGKLVSEKQALAKERKTLAEKTVEVIATAVNPLPYGETESAPIKLFREEVPVEPKSYKNKPQAKQKEKTTANTATVKKVVQKPAMGVSHANNLGGLIELISNGQAVIRKYEYVDYGPGEMLKVEVEILKAVSYA